MSSYLSSASQGVTDIGTGVGKSVGGVGKGVGQGVGELGKGVGQGAGELGKSVGIGGGSESKGEGGDNKDANTAPSNTTDGDQNTEQKNEQPPSEKQESSGGGGLGGALNTIGGTATQGLGAVGNAGIEIGGSLSKAGLDINKSVVKGVGTVGGTAVDGVTNLAATATDGVLSPVANSLKAIEGLESLGEGVDSINGISTQTLQGISKAAKGALDMAGKASSTISDFLFTRLTDILQTPTFFNPAGDGIVNMTDTQKGFVALGLEDRYAKIAAWALHSTFSYPTSESWNPTSLIHPKSGYEFPVRVENMDKTKWGRNWGNFERVEWVKDADVERFFGLQERTSWAQYWTDVQSYFGTALLIFEWGTTWPYVSVPGSDLVAGQIGSVLRTVILPTIAKTHEKEKAESGDKGSESRQPTPPPVEEPKA
ncbi:hypothetical protein AAF712_016288 [Marasmius tenuissimus]|uniref:Uncharacterized protein n=1 Tax=Marasmius tenuissimus TaxID=585030 RepID=A0ABR2Z744_9AGAR